MIRVLGWLEDFFDQLPIKCRADLVARRSARSSSASSATSIPQVFGTSYDTIRDMLNDRDRPLGSLIGISVAKFWALVISLGSGTTGGVFAPSLVVGGGLGAAFAMGCQHLLPHLVSDPAFYSLVAMAAVFRRHRARTVYQHRVSV